MMWSQFPYCRQMRKQQQPSNRSRDQRNENIKFEFLHRDQDKMPGISKFVFTSALVDNNSNNSVD